MKTTEPDAHGAAHGARSAAAAAPEAGRLDPASTTVHEAIHALPGAHEVFRRFGIDACCGGDLPLAVAVERHGVELDLLLDALSTAAREGRGAG